LPTALKPLDALVYPLSSRISDNHNDILIAQGPAAMVGIGRNMGAVARRQDHQAIADALPDPTAQQVHRLVAIG
jgi:hypothetical protein